jgi:hypothetical protein
LSKVSNEWGWYFCGYVHIPNCYHQSGIM